MHKQFNQCFLDIHYYSSQKKILHRHTAEEYGLLLFQPELSTRQDRTTAALNLQGGCLSQLFGFSKALI